jgi:membrane protein YdbS with pleckstrin-like domain
MPVIACPDCGRDVSTLAPACPHCGRPSPAGFAPPMQAPGAAMQEERLWRGSPSPVVLLMKVFVLLLIVVGVPMLAYAAARGTNDLQTSENVVKGGWLVMLLLAAVQIIAIIAGYVRLRGTLYTITNQRVIVERGLLSKSLSEIDLRTIDDTQFFQTVFDRMLGIGNVILVSSDKTVPMLVLRAIRDPRGVRETIRAHAYQVSQRQVFTRAT